MNLYGYTDNNPINYIDPDGLLRIYGNWCGPDWSGGKDKPWDDQTEEEQQTSLPPVDQLDSACQSHDKCYADCRQKFPCLPEERKRCFKDCDRMLGADVESRNVSNPVRWSIQRYMDRSSPKSGDNSSECCGE